MAQKRISQTWHIQRYILHDYDCMESVGKLGNSSQGCSHRITWTENLSYASKAKCGQRPKTAKPNNQEAAASAAMTGALIIPTEVLALGEYNNKHQSSSGAIFTIFEAKS